MNVRAIRVFGALFVILAGGGLGAILGLMLGLSQLGGGPPVWEMVPLPEGKHASGFLPRQEPALFVETSDGSLLALELPATFVIRDGAGGYEWTEVESTDGFDDSPFSNGDCQHKELGGELETEGLPETGTIVDIVGCLSSTHHDSGVRSDFAVLDDGTVWRMHFSTVGTAAVLSYVVIPFVWTVGGFLVGCAVGGVVFAAWALFGRRKSDSAEPG